MSTLTTEAPTTAVEPTAARVTEDTLSVDLADGRTVSVPTAWFPRLRHGTPAEWANVEFSPFGLHWPDLDEDISVSGLLEGRRSSESAGSFERWLNERKER